MKFRIVTQDVHMADKKEDAIWEDMDSSSSVLFLMLCGVTWLFILFIIP